MPKLIRHDEIAQIFCQDANVVETVMYVELIDTYFKYNEKDKYWMCLSEYETKNLMYQFLKTAPLDKGITMGMIHDVISLCSFDIAHRRSDDLSPFISLKDACLNLNTFEFVEADKENYSFQFLDFSSDDVKKQAGNTPLFTQFLKSSLVLEETGLPDEDLIELTQEMFGYLMLNNNPKHVAFNLVGSGRNGKSVMIDIITALAGGERFCSSFSLEQLSKPYVKSEIIGKKLNLCGEDESDFIKADVFKSLTSGDTVSAERKYLGTVTFKPKIKLVMSSNDYLRFNRVDEALMMRLIMMPFFKVFTHKEQIPHLSEKIIEQELPGVLAWAIEGAKKLARKNYVFTNPKSVEKQQDILKGIISSGIEFYAESFLPGGEEDTFLPLQEMYFDYQVWCETSGRKASSKTNFSKDICKLPDVDAINKWFNNKTTRGFYVKRII